MLRVSTWLAVVTFCGLLVLARFPLPSSLAQGPPTVVLTGARVIDGTGRAALERATVLIRNGRIEAVGTAAGVRIPDGAVRVDVSGKTIMPGLINAHAHLNDGDETLSLFDQLLAQLRLYAEYGVTTVHTWGTVDRPHTAHTPRSASTRGGSRARASGCATGRRVAARSIARGCISRARTW